MCQRYPLSIKANKIVLAFKNLKTKTPRNSSWTNYLSKKPIKSNDGLNLKIQKWMVRDDNHWIQYNVE